MSDEEQLSLIPTPENERLVDETRRAAEHKQGVYSGKDLKRYDEASYNLIVELLADGALSQRQIADRTGRCRNLVAGVAKMQTQDIEPVKKRIAAKFRNVGEVSADRAEEMLLDPTSKISFKDLMIGGGVAVDKSLTLAGEASLIIERLTPDGPSHDDVADFLKTLPTADVQEMGFGGGFVDTKGVIDEVSGEAGDLADVSDHSAPDEGVDVSDRPDGRADGDECGTDDSAGDSGDV